MARTLCIALTVALLIGWSPLSSHMLFMPGMEMDAMATPSQSGADQSTSSCCDAITPCSLGVDFLFPQFAAMALYGGSERVANLAPIVQPIYIKTPSPPPKT